jgi:hypothetical protein
VAIRTVPQLTPVASVGKVWPSRRSDNEEEDR